MILSVFGGSYICILQYSKLLGISDNRNSMNIYLLFVSGVGEGARRVT